MSKLNKLIQELCPDGVEYRKLGEVAEVGTGRSNGNEAIENGEYPFFVRSKDIKRLNKYEYDEEAIIIPGEGGIGDIFHHIKGKYALHQRVYRIHFLTDSVNVRFVYFYMSAAFKSYIMMKAVSATVTSIRKPMIENFPIPLPPLPIQEEIVKILDRFAEYTAELQARKEQYEYYRNLLFANNFAYGSADGKQKITGIAREEWKWMTLGEVCEKITSGGTPNTQKSSYYGGDIPWLRTQEVDFCNITDTGVKITEEGLNNSSAKWIPANCVIVAMYGATVGKTGINKIPLTTNQACCNLQINPEIALYKYVYYYLSNKYEYIKSLGQGSQTNINAKIVKKLQISIPPLAEQQRIVSILDKFEALVSDLTQGLPAEIAASQERYEYYRDKLLRFERCN